MTENKIILMIISGLGGIQSGPNMLTELQQAHKPNLNGLMRKAVCGLLHTAERGKKPEKLNALTGLLGYGSGPAVPFSKRFHRKAAIISADPMVWRVAAKFAIPVHKCPEGVAGPFTLSVPDRWDILIVHLSAAEACSVQKEYYEKVKILEEIDQHIPELLQLKPSVFCVTGDVTIPTAVGRITWHPVPVMIHATTCRYDMVQTFDEIACMQGGLKLISAKELMPLLLAHAELN